MKAVKVALKDAEKVRKDLIAKGALDTGHVLVREDDSLFIPVAAEVEGYEIVDRDFEKYKKSEGRLRDVLKGKLTDDEIEKAPHNFEVVGDIAIVEIDDSLVEKEKVIGEALLGLVKSVKVVLKKASQYSGEFRTRKLEVIAGEDRKTTEHRENGVRLRLNVETCYFSPRTSTERRRIYEQVKEGERILVMFSGVAPLPVVISKNTQAKEIVGVEINPDCHKYAMVNVIINSIKNVKLHNGDVREIVPKLGKFDRIMMPLPKSAEDFLDVALLAAKNGTVVHFYDFEHEKDIPKASIDKVLKHWKEAEILDVVKCGQYGPGRFRVCVDFKV